MRRSVVTFGETMARLAVPEHGKPGSGTPLSMGIGGAESNVAIAVSHLGVPATWMGRVGDDDLGSLVVREILGEGVRVIAQRDPEAPTGLMVSEHRRGRPYRVRYYRSGSAGAQMTPDDLDEEAIAAAGVLHLSGITPALGDGPAQAVEHAMKVARSAGTLVSFDVNYRRSLWRPDQAAPVLRDLLSEADIIFAGLSEAALLLDGDQDLGSPGADPWVAAREAARCLAALDHSHVVVKLGEHGALALRNGVLEEMPAVPVDVVDPVGAGDAFVGGYLAALVSDADLKACLTTGAELGALVCASPGDWEGVLDWHHRGQLGADDVIR